MNFIGFLLNDALRSESLLQLPEVLQLVLNHGQDVRGGGVAPGEEVAPVASLLPELSGLGSEVEDCRGLGGVDSAALPEDPDDFLLDFSEHLAVLLLGGNLADQPLGAVVLVLLDHLHVPVVRHDVVRHLPLQSHQLLHGDRLWSSEPLTVVVVIVGGGVVILKYFICEM